MPDLDHRFHSDDIGDVGIGVLGPVTVDGDRVGLGRRDRMVLVALAVQPGEAVGSERLADVLWAGEPPPSWAKVVQGCIVRLRRSLGRHAIETTPDGYRLIVPLDDIDAQRFERAVGRARDLLAGEDPERAAHVLSDALSLWRGQPLMDLINWDPARIESSRLDELHEAAEELYVEASLRSGQHERVLATARALVGEAPLRERRWALLATAQYRAGRQAEALRTLRQVRSVLNHELGLDPGPDLDALEQAILRQDPSMVVASALPEPSAVCPYRGLLPYDVEDSETYFGRNADVAMCLRRLAEGQMLAVVGPSGCGKSSLVRAGVAAALRRDGRQVVIITPGQHPMAAVTALPGSRSAPTLVVDQCEEVFSLCADEAERKQFLSTLSHLPTEVRLVLSFRADRLAEIAAYPEFARTVEQGMYLLGALEEGNLRAAIEEPARLASLVIEPGLVDLLVSEVAGRAGALPLMSHALSETWARRENRTLTVAGYRDSGGIRQAVAQSAEEVYSRFDASQQALLRDLLLRLVIPGREGEPVRSRLPRRLVVTDPEHDAMIDLLVESRLVTSDDGVVELAHEALARAWPRLQGWLEDDVEGQRILHHLAAAADSWATLGRPGSELYRGVRLAKALDWRSRTTHGLTVTERAFLDAGQQLADAELHAAEETARRQSRSNRRLRALLAVAVVLLLATGVAGLLATRATDRAQRETSRADQERTAADARRLGARALVSDDIALSMLLALEGFRLDDSLETRANLIAALGRKPELLRSASLGLGANPSRLDVSPDGATIAVQDLGNHVTLFDATSGEVIASYQAEGPRHVGLEVGPPLEFSPDGQQLVVGFHTFEGDPVLLLDADNLRPSAVQLGGLPQMPSQAIDVSFSPDGRRIAATFHEFRGGAAEPAATSSYVLVWDLHAPRQPRFRADFPGPAWLFQNVAFSPNGRTLYTSLPLRRYDVRTGRLLNTFDPGFWLSLEVNPDGTLVAMPDGFGPDVLLVDPTNGRVVHRLQGHTEFVYSATFSPDGRLLASTSLDRSVMVWDVASGERLLQLQTDDAQVYGLGFSADSQLLYTAGLDGALRTWDLTGNQALVTRLPVSPVTVGEGYVRLSPRGDTVAYVRRGYDAARTPRLLFQDVSTGRRTPAVDTGHGTFIGAGAWHPDGRLYATGGGDGVVRVWDRRGSALVRARQVAAGMITEVDYTQDGSHLVVSEQSGRVSMLNASTLAPTGSAVQLDEPTCCVTAGPDTGLVVVLTGGPSDLPQRVQFATGWALLDLRSGEVLRTGSLGIENGRYADFSPDGRHVAVVGDKGMLVVIDVETGLPLRPATVAHDGAAWWVGYNADGTQLLSIGEGGMVALWDGATAEMASSATAANSLYGSGASAGFSGAGFLPDGRSVLLVDASTGLYSWDTSMEAAVDAACNIAGRNLTAAEWQENLGDLPYEVTCPEYPAG